MSVLLQERQIKPIYDALETGSFKVALQTCNKILKKQPNLELVKALKALTLARAGKTEESSTMCDEILAHKPTDDAILGTLSHSLRALGRHDDVTAMYEEAFKKQPGNEELGAQTFMANVKISNWKVAQQVSTRMFKMFKSDRYLYWSIMSAVLQANDPVTAASTRSLLFGLSLRLIETASTPSFATPDRFFLHLSILFEMGRYAEANQLLTLPSGKHLCDTSLVIDEVRSQVAVKRGFWTIEGDLARQRLDGIIVDPQSQDQSQNTSDDPDQQQQPTTPRKDRNWLTFLAFLDATLRKQSEFSIKATMPEMNRLRDPKEIIREKQLETEDKAEKEKEKERGRLRSNAGSEEQSTANTEEEKEVVETTLEERVRSAREFLERLVESDGKDERGSLLALIELERRIRDENDLTSEEGAFVRLLSRYLHTFGDKPSCYEDLRPYVVTLTNVEVEQWRAILDQIPVDVSTEPNLRRLCNAKKLQRVTLFKDEITLTSEGDALQELVKLYWEALPLGKTLLKTDLQYADDLAVLAGEVLVSMWTISGDSTYIYSAIIFFEYALTRSNHNYQFRLMLIRLYRLLGAPSQALDHYHTLNPKQTQTDTLSHLILSRAATFSLASIGDLTMSNECLEASQIYAANSTETAEMIARAFQHEKYSQVQDFIIFEDRLDNSLQRDLTKVEHVRMRLTHENATAEVVDMELLEFRFIFDRIHHDNRDFTILPDHQPKDQSFDIQTVIGNVHPAFGWLEVWLKIYIRALTQASDYDENAKNNKAIDPLYLKLITQTEDQRPLKERVATASDDELAELTADERLFWEYATALAEWLGPFHEAVRPKASHDTSAAGPNPSSTTISTEAQWQDPPKILTSYHENAAQRLEQVLNAGSKECEWTAFHVAQLAQEAFVLFSIQTARFKSANKRKNDPLAQALKSLRHNMVSSLTILSNHLQKQCDARNGVERRRSLASCAEKTIPGIDYDYAYDVSKKLLDSQKRIFEGAAKGLVKISITHNT